jgi:class 3 adenylate cyclase
MKSPSVDLESVIRTLYDETSFQRNLDARLCGVLATILPDLKRRALIARFGAANDLLHYVTDGAQNFPTIEKWYGLFDRKILEAHEKSRNYIWGHSDDILIVDLALAVRDENGRSIPSSEINNYCVFLGDRALDPSFVASVAEKPLVPSDHKQFLDYILISYGINYALRFRKKVFSNFPTVLNKEYWAAAVKRPLMSENDPSVKCLLSPPWSEGGKRRTATLSLDMRRSTFAMEQSTDIKAYADWIEAFVLILQRIAQENYGVFDKFTGDGVLVHFLAEECKDFVPLSVDQQLSLERAVGWRTEMSATGQAATRCAVKCGFEMISAVQHHMIRLRQIISIDNSRIGPAVGIAIDQAQWSVDRDGGIIVVGRGLVQACRVTSEAQKGRIRLTAHAAQMLREIHGPVKFETKSFPSKEFPEGSGVTAEEMEMPPPGLCRPLGDICGLVEEIWADLDQRSAPVRRKRYG